MIKIHFMSHGKYSIIYFKMAFLFLFINNVLFLKNSLDGGFFFQLLIQEFLQKFAISQSPSGRDFTSQILTSNTFSKKNCTSNGKIFMVTPCFCSYAIKNVRHLVLIISVAVNWAITLFTIVEISSWYFSENGEENTWSQKITAVSSEFSHFSSRLMLYCVEGRLHLYYFCLHLNFS